MLNVQVLGAVRAYAGDHELALGGIKQRTLLARLAIARGHPISPERLVADLWSDDPPRNPNHALQARISRLRAIVPVDIELLDRGYCIEPARVHVDAVWFEQLCAQADWLLTEGRLDEAAENLREALELWSGSAFEALLDTQELRSEAVRLESVHAVALADRIDLDLSCGHHHAVIPELHALVAEHPLRERHWGQLMTALYCDRRPQEALEVFAQARHTFSERLGVEPNGLLGQMHVMILQEKPAASLLRWPAAARVSSGRDAARGIRDEPGLSQRLSVTSNEATRVAVLGLRGRALLLTGPAGIGKTHLLRAVVPAIETGPASATLLTASPLGRTVPLGVFAGVEGLDPTRGGSPAGVIDFFVRRRSMTVLLIDNVDELDEASLFVLSQLIRTSRLPTVMAVRDLTAAPQEIRALYDSGEIVEVEVDSLGAAEAEEMICQLLGGSPTPAALPRLVAAASGNPLQLREIVVASVSAGRLVQTEHGWELRGAPSSTPRLSQLVGERFGGLDDASIEDAAKVAIAGAYPPDALGARRALARAGVLEIADHGWLRLAHPLDSEFLRSRCSNMLWRDLTLEVVETLRSESAIERPEARYRACVLALDLDDPIDTEGTLALAEQALGAYDERLALRAAEAVIERASVRQFHLVRAHRVAGQAASALGELPTADTHFEAARRNAASAPERAEVAIAHADHLGVRHHDAAAALHLIREVLASVDEGEAADLERIAMRWATVAGRGGDAVGHPGSTSDAETALGLITVGMSAVITGPLTNAERALAQLRRMPEQVIDLVPGGAALVEVTEVMALSNTGDVVATRHRLQQAIAERATTAPETLGLLTYALGFAELLSGDVNEAYRAGGSAVQHLRWRDAAGLLPAARALAGAAAEATGRTAESCAAFSAIPWAAREDPKVVMLQAWTEGLRAHTEGRRDHAASLLVASARMMLTMQHTYFAGVLAHCAVRIGTRLTEAVAVLDEASMIAGGGMLEVMARHARTVRVGDVEGLDVIASEAAELGMASTAADTWLALSRASPEEAGSHTLRSRRQDRAIEQLRAEFPAMVLWAE